MSPRRLLSALAGVAALAALINPAAAGNFGAGSSGLDDAYFPYAGNGGYDVQHYSLILECDPSDGVPAGLARGRPSQGAPPGRIDDAPHGGARSRPGPAAPPGLSEETWPGRSRGEAGQRMRLGFIDGLPRGLADSLTPGIARGVGSVGTVPATYERAGQELIVTPKQKINAGARFRIEVDYHGVPIVIVDADKASEGWITTFDGAFVVGEPQGAPGWFPSNDTPNDKATFDFTVTVPAGLTALANGLLLGAETDRGKTIWRWRHDDPMATYLATSTIGRFDFTQGAAASGIPWYNAVDSAYTNFQKTTVGNRLALQPSMIEFMSQTFGPYPFDSFGAIVDRVPVGYSLESQTKPNYSSLPDELTILHELAHQWFGNSISLAVWSDIWLNEGFATWCEWYWREHRGSRTAQQEFDIAYSTVATNSHFWNPPPGIPGGPANLFDGTIYIRGAMTLQALRQKVGDATFFEIMRQWYARHRNGNVRTADFVALSEEISGLDLDDFFQVWLFTPGKPTSW